jgi:hypothetical protein
MVRRWMMTAPGNDKLLSQNDKTRALRRMLINLRGLPQTIRPCRTCSGGSFYAAGVKQT